MELILKSQVKITDQVKQASDIFDYAFTGETETKITIPEIPKSFQIGLIVGSSGSGKTTILNQLQLDKKEIGWNNSKAIISHFETYQEATEKFGASGLNSVPTWMKPYYVLSTGERFRADLSRMLEDNTTIDEFTSTVNREVAMSCSISVAKYIRKQNLKNIIFSSCHYDVIKWLEPDWIYDTDTQSFLGREERRPTIELEVVACSTKAWGLFKKHHYLSEDIHKSATCYMATMNDQPVAFIALMHLTGRDVKSAWREHRVCVLPDFQGMGIGNAFSEYIAQCYKEQGLRYFSKTSNPRFGIHRNNSTLWRPTANNMKKRPSYFTKEGEVREQKGFGVRNELQAIHANRVCYSHEYLGGNK